MQSATSNSTKMKKFPIIRKPSIYRENQSKQTHKVSYLEYISTSLTSIIRIFKKIYPISKECYLQFHEIENTPNYPKDPQPITNNQSKEIHKISYLEHIPSSSAPIIRIFKKIYLKRKQCYFQFHENEETRNHPKSFNLSRIINLNKPIKFHI